MSRRYFVFHCKRRSISSSIVHLKLYLTFKAPNCALLDKIKIILIIKINNNKNNNKSICQTICEEKCVTFSGISYNNYEGTGMPSVRNTWTAWTFTGDGTMCPLVCLSVVNSPGSLDIPWRE